MPTHFSARCGYPFIFAFGVLFLAALIAPAAAQDLSADQQAAALIDSAKRAFNEKQWALATEQFRKFIAAHGGHKEITAARYGLAVAILEGPAAPGLPNGIDRDYGAAIQLLQQVAGAADFPDRPFALHYLGAGYRGQGAFFTAQAIAKPAEAAQHRQNAHSNYEQAGNFYAQALAAFTQRLAAATIPPAGELPADAEWAARSRSDLAEMQLRTGKVKEALATSEPFMKDPVLNRSRFRDLGRYYHGYAHFLAGDFLASGRTLALLAPFKDPIFGVHARYLLARAHHLADETPEAAALYESLLTDYQAQIAAATEALKTPDQFKANPREKERLEALVKGPAPEYLERAGFYSGVLMLETGKTGEAAERFTKFIAAFPKSPLLPEAQLQLGYAFVKAKNWAEAAKVLPALQDHPQLGYQARWYLARLALGAADPNNAQAVQQATAAAAQQYRAAADRAGQLAAQDGDAKLRRADILLELGDTLAGAKQPADAIAVYQTVVNEKTEPQRVELATQRLATAQHLAGQYPQSDQTIAGFVAAYPRSTLLPAVLFRAAENAFALADAGAKNPEIAKNPAQVKALYDEAVKRYKAVIEKFPEFESINTARFGMGLSQYRVGGYDDAFKTFGIIGSSDRVGDLALCNYLMADCLIRTAPADATDAIATGRLLSQLNEAIKLLDSFIAGNEKHPELVSAIIRIGDCRQRVAAIIVEPNERNQTMQLARAGYERVMQQFAVHPLMPTAVLERAKVMAMQGDGGGAFNELNRFNGDPLQKAPVAPLAFLRMAQMQRQQNKPADAAKTMETARQKFEAGVAGDPTRAAWVPLMQYHHALALKESGKPAEARAIFDNVVKAFPASAEAPEAAWRSGQCRQEIIRAALQQAKIAMNKGDAKPEEKKAAGDAYAKALGELRETAQYFESTAGPVGQKAPGSEAHLRMFYEAAWCWRTVGEVEVETARALLAEESRKKAQELAAKNAEPGKPAPVVNAPIIALSAVPWQPAQQKAMEQYQQIVKASSDAPLAILARFEQAEMHAVRDAFDAAIPLLTEAVDLEPEQALSDRIRLRLGACYLGKNDATNAAEQFGQSIQSKNPLVAAESRYRTAEVKMLAKDFAGAIQLLVPFRDKGELHQFPGVSDRATLRLGHAYGYAGQWNESRQAMETLIGRYGNSEWKHEARYGMGWALQNQKQWDQAIAQYREVTKATAAEVAAKAQLQVGICLREQKKLGEAATALLVVPFTYDYPQWSGAALVEAASVLKDMQQIDQAKALLNRAIKDYAATPWAKVAQERLAEIK